MATNVVMPQMGESVAEGTIVRWLKKVGDAIERDEPLFEISTDKVDAEIPSPTGGVITEILHHEGETVAIHTVVAVIGAAGSAVAAPPAPAPAVSASPSVVVAAPAAVPVAAAPAVSAAVAPTPAPPVVPAAPTPAAVAQVTNVPATPSSSGAEGQRLSPVVKKIAQEHNVDVSRIQGTGIGGRVTKNDILAFMEQSGQQGAAPQSSTPQSATGAPVPPPAPSASATATTGAAKPAPAGAKSQPVPGTSVPMTVMRKKIAEHMIFSRKTSAHVHTVFEMNCSRIDQIRKARKAEFEQAGTKLTYMSFIIKAAVDALRAVPVVNSSIDGDTIVYHKDINIGIAVALEWGLIVPVIRKADEKNLLGLSRAIVDLANRARAKKLSPEEVQGGTFTVTNPGAVGAQFGMPIINQPQVAIMGIGVVEKRAVVVDDAIAIRPMAYFSLGFDHRIIDGAAADEFMAHIKHTLENWDPNAV